MAPLLTYSTLDRLRDRIAWLQDGQETPREVLILELQDAAREIDRLERRCDELAVELAQPEVPHD